MAITHFAEPQQPVKLAPEYSIKTSLIKGLKVGVAAAVGWLLADPNMLTSLTQAVPFKYRMAAGLLIPMIFSALKNWQKQQAAQ